MTEDANILKYHFLLKISNVFCLPKPIKSQETETIDKNMERVQNYMRSTGNLEHPFTMFTPGYTDCKTRGLGTRLFCSYILFYLNAFRY